MYFSTFMNLMWNDLFVNCRLCEEHLSAMHRDEVQQLSDEYNSEKERMLSEFMEAQELLKDKISTLNLM